MKSMGSFLILASLIMSLSACVQLKDPDKGGSDPDVAPTAQPQLEATDTRLDLKIEGEMYVQGKEIVSDLSGNPVVSYDLEQNYRSIIFAKEAVLYTMGNDLKLSADVFSAPNEGQIATFPPSTSGLLGRNGGHIEIDVQKADGNLSIDLHGEDGAPGRAARPLQPKSKITDCSDIDGITGENGQDGGDAARFVFEAKGAQENELHIFPKNRLPGVGGIGGASTPSDSCLVGGKFANSPVGPRQGTPPGTVSNGKNGAPATVIIYLGPGNPQNTSN